MFKSIGFLLLLVLSFNGYCQGEIIFNSGKTVRFNNVSIEDGKVRGDFYKKKRKGEKKINKDFPVENVFAINHDNKEQWEIIYVQDTSNVYDLNVEDMEFYVLGEQEALLNHKTELIQIVGFAGGAALGYFLYSSVAIIATPIIYTGIVLIPKVRIKREKLKDENLLEKQAFIEGYVSVAKTKKVKSALISNASGILAGAIVGILLR